MARSNINLSGLHIDAMQWRESDDALNELTNQIDPEMECLLHAVIWRNIEHSSQESVIDIYVCAALILILDSLKQS